MSRIDPPQVPSPRHLELDGTAAESDARATKGAVPRGAGHDEAAVTITNNHLGRPDGVPGSRALGGDEAAVTITNNHLGRPDGVVDAFELSTANPMADLLASPRAGGVVGGLSARADDVGSAFGTSLDDVRVHDDGTGATGGATATGGGTATSGGGTTDTVDHEIPHVVQTRSRTDGPQAPREGVREIPEEAAHGPRDEVIRTIDGDESVSGDGRPPTFFRPIADPVSAASPREELSIEAPEDPTIDPEE